MGGCVRTGLTWQGPCLQSQLWGSRWRLCLWVSCPQVLVPGMHHEAQPGVRATSSENLNQLWARVSGASCPRLWAHPSPALVGGLFAPQCERLFGKNLLNSVSSTWCSAYRRRTLDGGRMNERRK